MGNLKDGSLLWLPSQVPERLEALGQVFAGVLQSGQPPSRTTIEIDVPHAQGSFVQTYERKQKNALKAFTV